MPSNRPSQVLTVFVSLLLILFTSCQSQQKGEKTTTPPSSLLPHPPGYTPAQSRVVTDLGENDHPRFSPDGKTLFFVSSHRPKHDNTQIYSLNLSSRKIKRLTFHDGNNGRVQPHPLRPQVLYSSTTDEIKENPLFLRRALNELKKRTPSASTESNETQSPPEDPISPLWPRYELYLSDLKGHKIQRLTHSPLFDGDATFHPQGNQIVFSSLRTGEMNLYTTSYRATRRTRGRKKWQKERPLTKGPQWDIQATFSPSGKNLAWVQKNADSETSQIVVANSRGQNPILLTTGDFSHLSPQWSPDEENIVFSSNRSDSKNFELYVMKKDGRCLKRLTYHKANETNPTLSPNGQQIAFVSDRSGQKQVYIMPFLPPKTCSNPEASLKYYHEKFNSLLSASQTLCLDVSCYHFHFE